MNAREIAGKLTEAQRAMMLALPLPALTCDWRTMPSLRKRSLVSTIGWPPKLKATHLGLEVRAILLEEQGR